MNKKYSIRLFLGFCLTLLFFTLQAQVKIIVDSPTGLADIQALEANFTPPLMEISATLVMADDTTGTTSDACEPVINDLTGAIALIDRGGCGFTNKIYNAQLAGAIAVVVCNNDTVGMYKAGTMGAAEGDPLIDLVAIPAVQASFSACQEIKMNMPGVMVTLSPEPIPSGTDEVCETATAITPGTYTVDSITSGFGAVFVSGVLDNNANAKWYSYTPTTNNLATVTSCGALTDTRLAILSGPDCATLTLVDVNDDCDFDNDEYASELSFIAVAGTQYFIYWDDRWDYHGFDFTLSEGALPQATVTFNVDMSEETVSGDGVNLAYAGPDAMTIGDVVVVAMDDVDADGVYSASVSLTVLDTIGYAFVNGMLSPANVEVVPAECGEASGLGFNFRPYIVGGEAEIPAVCFGSCTTCAVTDCDAPLVMISDDIEGYTAGNATGQAPHWNQWPGATLGAMVSTDTFQSGAQSILIDGTLAGQDALLVFGDRTDGHYRISFSVFVPSGSDGYFNLQHMAPTAAAGFWAIDVYFDDGGEGRLETNDGGAERTFSYNQDEWVDIFIYVDIDNDEARLIVGEYTVEAWAWSNAANAASTQLNSINFFPIDAGYKFYVDDVEFWQIPAAGEGQYCYNATEIGLGTYTIEDLGCYGGGYHLDDGVGGQKAAWFKYVAESDGVLSISSCGGGVDTRGWMFLGDDCHDLHIIGVNDDQCDIGDGSEWASYREAIVTAGDTYYIMWDDVWDNAGFDFTLALSTDPAPEGDFCQTAFVIQPGEQTLEEFTGNGAVTGPTIGNTSQGRTPTAYTLTEWYAFTPETDGLMTILSCNGTDSDTRFWVYTGDCTTFDGLTLVSTDDDGCGISGGPSLQEDIPVTGGTTYYIEWDNGWISDAFLWELIFAIPQVAVTFNVDMQNEEVDPSGVFVSGTFNDGNDLAMTDGDADGIYSVTVDIPQNQAEVRFKYKNGNVEEDINTSLGEDCTTGDNNDRFFATTDADLDLDAVCFGWCVTCNIVAVDDVALSNQVDIFPNPAKDMLNVQFDFTERPGQFNIRMMNTLGIMVYQNNLGQAQNGKLEIDLTAYPSGTYFLQLTDGDAHLTHKVMIE
ncbi:MAG: hypothetical protein DHS20C18_31630 [Saprospiraceae bacterium]|nr:MAG: hypothetical protein DHS20C18_31630 [Saprospiraceae bacterium]